MATAAQLAKKLANYDANKKSSADILNEAMAKYNVPEIRKNVADLRTTLENTQQALNNVDPSVTGRTSRSLVTEAQRQAMVNNERAPIAANLSKQQGELGIASANLQDQQSAAKTLANGEISDYSAGRSALEQEYQDAVAREAAALAKKQADRAYKLKLRQQAAAEKQNAISNARSAASTAQPSLKSKIRTMLNASTGSDGKVSPGTWRNLVAYAYAHGMKFGGKNGFANTFWSYANPSHWQDYKNGYQKYM